MAELIVLCFLAERLPSAHHTFCWKGIRMSLKINVLIPGTSFPTVSCYCVSVRLSVRHKSELYQDG